MIVLYFSWLTIELFFFIILSVVLISFIYASLHGAFYLPTKRKYIKQIFNAINLKPHELFIDLGSGDGRLVRAIVKKYHCRGLGIDINPIINLYAKIITAIERIDNCNFITANVLTYPLPKAKVIYMFLMPNLLKQLTPLLFKQLDRHCLLISHGFKIPALDKYLVKSLDYQPFPFYFYQKS